MSFAVIYWSALNILCFFLNFLKILKDRLLEIFFLALI